jgi:ribonuclease G
MQCSFIDLGSSGTASYVADVVDAMAEFDKLDSDDDEGRKADGGKGERRQPKIEELLKEGQEILVEVVKEPLGTKGARLTSHVTTGFWCSCRQSTTSAFRARLSRAKNADGSGHRARVP